MNVSQFKLLTFCASRNPHVLVFQSCTKSFNEIYQIRFADSRAWCLLDFKERNGINGELFCQLLNELLFLPFRPRRQKQLRTDLIPARLFTFF